MNKILIKNKFLFFTIFLIFYSVFYLIRKHNGGLDWSVSEWLINYQGGFTRRGLGGEINIFLSNFFSISLRDAILFLQIMLHSSYLILFFILIKDLKLDIIQIFALFSPLFLLYPIAELEGLGRKEMSIFLSFLIVILLSDKKIHANLVNLFVLIFFPILCLIWEQVILLAPFFAVVLINKNRLYSFAETFIKIFLIFLPSIIVILVIFTLPLSNEGHNVMCKYLETKFNERCYGSADLLITNTIYFDTFWIHLERTNFFHCREDTNI